MTDVSLRHLFIVDDDDAVRDSLEAMLSAKGFTIEVFASGERFLERVSSAAVPACVLLDIRMPGMDGLAVLQRLTGLQRALRVVMITGHADVSTAVKAMKAGAFDFIEKPFTQDLILEALEAAVATLADAGTHGPGAGEIAERLAGLSPRERDVMERLVDGLTNKEIARDLAISPRTVEVYRAGVMEKMGARNLSSLVKMGMAAGLSK